MKRMVYMIVSILLDYLGADEVLARPWQCRMCREDRIVTEIIKKVLMFLSGLRRAPAKNEPVLEIPPAPIPDWISLEQFRRATGLGAAKAIDWYQHVRAACIEFDIIGPARIAAFLAQVGHESGGFVYTREIWGPTPAQLRYEGRADLGNIERGDGS
ncbi:MAG: hypothetical protein WBF88_17335, partial [Pusillimonas sp.]